MTQTELFNPDLYAKGTFPIDLFRGISNYGESYTVYSKIPSERDLSILREKIKTEFDNRTNSQFSHEFALNSDLEKELVLLTHLFQNSGYPFQHLLGDIRQERAFNECENELRLKFSSPQTPSYHNIAFLYYTLMHGASTLGHYYTAEQSYVPALRKLRQENITNPQVLLLGFSTIYSLENLAAMLHLVGFKESTILAIDKMPHPIIQAQNYCGNKLFNSTIEYKTIDILTEPLPANKFDLIATHLFFTHFRWHEKSEVWTQIKKSLKPGREFVDEELIVPGSINRESFNNYFRSLAQRYHPSETSFIRSKVSEYMYIFGSQGPFNPYSSLADISHDTSPVQLQLTTRFINQRNMYAQDNTTIEAKMYALRAKK